MTDSQPPTAPTAQDAPPAYDPNRTGWVPPPALPTRKPSPFRSAGVRARWLLWLLAANVIVAIIGVAVSAWGKVVIGDYEAGSATIADLDRFDSVFAFDATLELVALIVAVVAWLAWSSRTVDNEDALGIGPSKVTPALAIAWWFLPIANLVMPYVIHKEIYERYHRGLGVGAGIVVLWWLVYVGCGVFGTVIGQVWTAAETFPALQFGLTLYVVAGLANAVSGLIAIVMVRRIQTRADVLATTGTLAAPPIAGMPSAT